MVGACAVSAQRRRAEGEYDVKGRRGASRSLVLLLALSATALLGCGLGDKAARADRVIDSVDRLEDRGTVGGTLTLRLAVVEVPAAAGALAAVPKGETPARPTTATTLPIAVAIDVAHQRAALGAADAPEQIFDGLVAYGQRTDAQDGDARPWMKVDLTELGDGIGDVDFAAVSPVAMRNALSPSFVVDLIAGALSGSVEQAGKTEVVAGAPTTRFDANFDVEKAVQDTRRDRYPEDDRDALYDTLDLLTVKGRVFPGAVWLDADGLPRRFQVALRVSPRKGFVFEIELDLVLDTLGTASVPASPTDLELLETDSLPEFLQAVTPALGTA